MNKQILNNTIEDFLLKYKAAIKVKLTKQQLSEFLNIKPHSLMRKKLKIEHRYGLSLPYLLSDPKSKLNDDITKKYLEYLNYITDSIKKTIDINNHNNVIEDDFKNKKYVITSAQNDTPVFKEFLETLKTYCKHNDANLCVIPYRYKNPTSIWSTENKTAETWARSILPYLLTHEYKVAKHLKIMGNIKIQPTATSPLSGFDTVTGLDSAIFGHPNVEWKTIPAIYEKLPKVLLTTGSVTIPNYTDSKAGHKGAMHHTFGASVIEVDNGGDFHIRQITADDKGGFYDLDKYYCKDTITSSQRALAIVAGDIHAEVVDEIAVKRLFTDSNSLSNTVDPENFVFHDIIDYEVRSHHTIRDDLGRFKKHYFDKNNNVEEALQKVADFITRVNRKNTRNHIVKSNHDEHIDRWLREANPSTDPENAKFFYYLKYNQYKAIINKEHFDPIKYWCKNPDELNGLSKEVYDNTNFLTRRDGLEIGNIELSMHGDAGPNGSRGSLRSLSKLGLKIICGHSHTPGIMNGSYQVGTTSELKLDYMRGPSSWMTTCAVIYKNGTISLINVINGKWRA